MTDHIQVYGLIDNLFDKHFGRYGFDTDEASEASLGEFNFTDARSFTPSMPFAAYEWQLAFTPREAFSF